MQPAAELQVVAHGLGHGQQRMRQSLGVKQRTRACLIKFGKHILRMLVGIGGQRGQRFQLAHGRQPAANLRSKLLLPALGHKHQLHAPVDKNVQRPERQVAPRFDDFDGAG